jgi:hypothetical protein
MLSPKEYAERQGAVCPVCGSKNIVAGNGETRSDIRTENIDCNGCGASWTDIFTLSGYDNLEEVHE